MGKRTTDEVRRKKLLYDLAKHIYKKKGISYQAQANAINITPARYTSLRTDSRYIVEQGDIDALREAYRAELEDFGQPSAIDEELARLRAELAALREKVGKKESLNEELQELLIEAQKKIKELGG